MKHLLLLILLYAAAVQAQGNPDHGLRSDKLKQQPIRAISKGYEVDTYIVRVRYLNDTYTEHQFPNRKHAKSFLKVARTLIVSTEKRIKYDNNN